MFINTDNIIFEKTWDDYNGFNKVGNLFQINVTAYNYFVKINNFSFYMDERYAKKISDLISRYIKENKTVVFEHKNSVYNNEIMLMEIKQANLHGHIIINLKIENSDNSGNKNNVELFIETELGLLENFGKNILELVKGETGYKISLNKELD